MFVCKLGNMYCIYSTEKVILINLLLNFKKGQSNPMDMVQNDKMLPKNLGDFLFINIHKLVVLNKFYECGIFFE